MEVGHSDEENSSDEIFYSPFIEQAYLETLQEDEEYAKQRNEARRANRLLKIMFEKEW